MRKHEVAAEVERQRELYRQALAALNKELATAGFDEPTDEERAQNRLTNVDHPLHLLKAT